MNRWKATLALVLGIWSAGPLFARDRKTQPSIQVQTQYGRFVFSELKVGRDSINEWVLSGWVANETDRSWPFAKFDVQLLGRGGRPVGEGVFAISDFLKHETRTITDDSGLGQGATLGFAQGKTKVTNFEVSFLQDDSAFDFQYVISMTKPVQSDALSYSDSEVAVRFTPGDLQRDGPQLRFSLLNKTESPIAVPWDKVSYVDQSGGSHRVIHEGVRLVDRDRPQAATTVPPTARLDDFIYPSDYAGSDRSLLPLHQPNAVVGSSFSVFMPLVVRGREKDILFTFKVERVEPD
jgi:hypothetical protein